MQKRWFSHWKERGDVNRFRHAQQKNRRRVIIRYLC